MNFFALRAKKVLRLPQNRRSGVPLRGAHHLDDAPSSRKKEQRAAGSPSEPKPPSLPKAPGSGMRVLRLRGSREHFLTGGRSPVVGKCYRHEALLTTTQVVGNKTSLSVEQQSHTGPRRVPQRSRLPCAEALPAVLLPGLALLTPGKPRTKVCLNEQRATCFAPPRSRSITPPSSASPPSTRTPASAPDSCSRTPQTAHSARPAPPAH